MKISEYKAFFSYHTKKYKKMMPIRFIGYLCNSDIGGQTPKINRTAIYTRL